METFAKAGALLLLSILTVAPVNIKVLARNPDWKPSGIALAPGQLARISASGKWRVIDPGKRDPNGASGNGVTSTSRFRAPGKPEGCLLVKAGDDSIYTFEKDNDVITIGIPGKISFLANDEDTDGRKRKGFDDNDGELNVEITIEKP